MIVIKNKNETSIFVKAMQETLRGKFIELHA